MSSLDCHAPDFCAARLYSIERFDGQMLWVSGPDGSMLKVAVSIRYSAAQVRDWVRQGARVLVVPVAKPLDGPPTCFGVGIDFIGAADAPCAAQVLCVDEIRMGNGAARIFWATDALHIAAENIDSQARFVHRITGGSIKIG